MTLNGFCWVTTTLLEVSINDVLDDQVPETQHINKLFAKMGKNWISVVKGCAKFLKPNPMKQFVQILILSHLDYCPTLRGTKKQIKK